MDLLINDLGSERVSIISYPLISCNTVIDTNAKFFLMHEMFVVKSNIGLN